MTSFIPWRRAHVLRAALLFPAIGVLAVAYLPAPARSVPDGSLSHLSIHALVLPPPGLIRPIRDNGSPVKGMNPEAEEALLEALEARNIAERILKVAVAGEGGAPVALVKVQAGDAHSRVFSLAEVERDATRCLEAAFALPIRLRHVDFWAVVPETGQSGDEVHRPVFSVAAERATYLSLRNGAGRSERELLAGLSAVRYDPVFTRHAIDWPQAQGAMPRTAYSASRLKDVWAELLSEGIAARSYDVGPEMRVSAILGGAPNGPQVALTIDDGPRPLITPLFLDILRRENVKATFFVVGEKAEEYPGLIREIARDGHELANHAYSNRRFSTLSPEEVYAELRGCSRIISTLTGEIPKYMRPPGGDYTAESLAIAERLGLTTALWTHNTGDWRKPKPTAIAYNATRGLRSGDIILMHQGDMRSVRALPMIIERVRAKGLAPSRLSDLSGNGFVRKMSIRAALAERGRLCLVE